ncbi:glutamate--cysteine ligase [Dactylosporangium sp. NPDC051541]|uniref:glutamate--cysteine ligase n=1 Tax=Dactylosporangium sp. NPDC051541 TaxID=3363977 RepID=UPI00379AB7A7
MPLTVGVEEEFLLLDPSSWHSVPKVREVRAALPRDVWPASRHEFRLSCLEMVTPVCTDLTDLRSALVANRTAAAAAAARAGVRLVAVGATPVAEPDRSAAHSPRYRAIARHYGPIARDPAVCAAHVHVGVDDRDRAVRICTALRPWLPVLQAMTANSPFADGADTGHDSWRGVVVERWPTLGPPPPLTSWADYERTVAELVATGALYEPELVWWHARPSLDYPTVEVRIADVSPTADDAVLLAALVRGLVASVGAIVDVPEQLLRAAHWNACHTGLSGNLMDLRHRVVRPAWDLVEDLVATVTPALIEHGDLALVREGLVRLYHEGNGATRLRRAPSLADALRTRAAQTAAGERS